MNTFGMVDPSALGHLAMDPEHPVPAASARTRGPGTGRAGMPWVAMAVRRRGRSPGRRVPGGGRPTSPPVDGPRSASHLPPGESRSHVAACRVLMALAGPRAAGTRATAPGAAGGGHIGGITCARSTRGVDASPDLAASAGMH
jgi:hypothetical protein